MIANHRDSVTAWAPNPVEGRPREASPCVLILESEPGAFDALRPLLRDEGYDLENASLPVAALAVLDQRDIDSVLLELNDGGGMAAASAGLDLISRVHAADPSLPIVVMTRLGSSELAVEALRRGARDFVPTPWETVRLLTVVRAQVEFRHAVREAQRLKAENQVLRDERRPRVVAESAAMRHVLQVASRIAPSDANVLILGENGTGKRLVAQLIHSASARAARPMITVVASGMADTALEAELFGHTAGAVPMPAEDRLGRVELASGGTLYVEDIACVPLSQQQKLLRLIESGQYEPLDSSRTRRADVRLMSSTTGDLGEEVAAGRFRQDLVFRLNTVEIRVPPLRERREDLPLLAQHFLVQHARRYRKAVTGFDSHAEQALLEHPWPGNVRELDHVVERAVLLTRDRQVRTTDLALKGAREPFAGFEDMGLEEVERFLVKRAMTRTGGNVSRAARALGLSRSALYRRMQRYGL